MSNGRRPGSGGFRCSQAKGLRLEPSGADSRGGAGCAAVLGKFLASLAKSVGDFRLRQPSEIYMSPLESQLFFRLDSYPRLFFALADSQRV